MLISSLTALWLSGSANAGKVTIPVDIGLGPAAHLITGPVQEDQTLHTGLAMSVQAIIDKKTIKKNAKRIPRQYRKAAKQMDEVRFSPSIFIPDTLFISPKVENTGIMGISWAPVGVGVPLIKRGVRVSAGAELRLTYAYLYSDTLSNTHFLRPGLAPRLVAEIPITKHFLVSTGWNSQLYIPQAVGGPITEMGELEDSIWHIGQAFFKFHYRFPYTVQM